MAYLSERNQNKKTSETNKEKEAGHPSNSRILVTASRISNCIDPCLLIGPLV